MLSRQMTKQFQNISQKVRTNFYEAFSSTLEVKRRDMEKLKEQGNANLDFWKEMMLNYKDLWTKPFFVVSLTAILMSVVVSAVTFLCS